MKRTFLILFTFIFVLSACAPVTVVLPTSPALPTNTIVSAVASPTQIPASDTPIPPTVAPSPTIPAPSFEGLEVSVDPLSVVVAPALASGVRVSRVPRAYDPELRSWGWTPGHTVLELEGYVLQEKFHKPAIYVYPAQGYAEMLPIAFESMQRLNDVLSKPAEQISAEQLPIIPFFNAAQVFASKIEILSFQNGRGVRYLTEYAQYPASANNTDLFYLFQGVSNDGAYYIVAILPITHPSLAATSDAGAPLPPEGVPYPYFANPGADMTLYYKSVTDILNANPQDAFTPMINQLDLLIQSMRVAP